MLRRTIWVLACTAVMVNPVRSEDKPNPAAIEHFEKHVRPVLLAQCGNCHGTDPKKIKGGLVLTTKAGLLAGGEAGVAVVPGKPDESLLVQMIRYDGDIKMPPKGRLKDHDIANIVEWVKNGAAWPDTQTEAPVKPAPAKGPLFTAEQKAFWAFQPITEPNPPKIADTSKVANPIDAFIVAKLQEKGLTSASTAEKRTLIRRVTFDLTGLPPTPEEIDAFLADSSPTAFATVVDRLLSSPAYGERWGRHWLDVARYADSNGLDENTAFANAWRYRDYVVAAFNADKPYDQFLREQLAADLLPAAANPQIQKDRLAALGYLTIGAKLLAEPDKQKMLLDIADEQLDTLGKGMMGLTLGCARCHDHKFDPLPTRDYYSLLAIFTSTRTMQNLNTVAKAFERPLDGPEKPEVTAARKRLEESRKEVRKLEQEFGKTPETDKEKRTEIHLKAEKLRAEIKELEKFVVPPMNLLSVEEGSAAAYGTQPRNLHVQVRGNYVTPGEEAPSVFLRIIAGEQQTEFVKTSPNTADKPQPSKIRYGSVRASSGRLELANWLTDPKHPLTARVFVNRVWKHHFGEGIVRSMDNFGKLGERPTHPELLDWLATQFIKNGWSVKNLHRLIVLSKTYQMRNAKTPPPNDPENRFLSYFPRRRLEAEAIRDAMLAVAGNLDSTVGGTIFPHGNFEYVGTPKYETTRRSIYLPVIRNNVFPFFQTFDFPDPSTMNGQRVSTVVAPQALYMLNSPFVVKQAEVLAERLEKAVPKDDSARIRLAYRLALGREPTAEESADMLGFVKQYQDSLAESEKDATKRTRQAWAVFCHTLFASNEFVFVE